ncbi:hypothetical protein [Streptomyces exfoliatus]|uniref:hypothetical protein n=1 Tax=Streptomyces exfoliatus TaxID=1905 RepID=UPI0037B7EEF9
MADRAQTPSTRLPFDPLPDSAQEQADPYEHTASVLCLVVNAEAPAPEGQEREVTARLALTVLDDGAYINTGLVVPHRKRLGGPADGCSRQVL